jgi:hypothetical protein
MERRQAGGSWESCAADCTESGLVSTSVIRNWYRRFGCHRQQRLTFRPPEADAMLVPEAESRQSDPSKADSWERSPPKQP